MPRGFLLKMRGRMNSPEARKVRLKKEMSRLEKLQNHLEDDIDSIRKEIETLEELEEIEAKRHHEFGWVKGKITMLSLQDFVGAAFGALFFVVTQEVWTISLRLEVLNISAIFILSALLTYLLIYLSRRRKTLSDRIYNTSFMRALEIYTVSLATSFVFVIIFGTAVSAETIMKQSIVVALPATISAATADLLFY